MEPVKLRLRKRSSVNGGCGEYELRSPLKKECRLKAEKENEIIGLKEKALRKKSKKDNSVLKESIPRLDTNFRRLSDGNSSSESDDLSDLDELENIFFNLKKRGIKTISSRFSKDKKLPSSSLSLVNHQSNNELDKFKYGLEENHNDLLSSKRATRKTIKPNTQVDKKRVTPLSQKIKNYSTINEKQCSDFKSDFGYEPTENLKNTSKVKKKSTSIKKNLESDFDEKIDLKNTKKGRLEGKSLKISEVADGCSKNKTPPKTPEIPTPELEKEPEKLILNYKRISKQVSRYEVECTPQKTRNTETPKKSSNKKRTSFALQIEKTSSKIQTNELTPIKLSSRKKKETSVMRTPACKMERKFPTTPLEKARHSLNLASFPEILPCREKEYTNIMAFVKNKLLDGIGGCMYISGVPGTGKTATVTQVMKNLQLSVSKGEVPEFKYIEINGLRLSDPRQAYVLIWQKLFDSEERILSSKAQKLLDTWFSQRDKKNKKKTTVLLVDELDLICTKKQDVIYNLLEWPTRTHSHLVVLTIANTMDMPERLFKGRITSRMGLTRLTFLPYTFKQLEEIVFERLKGLEAFVPDAIQLVTRKVAAVSGDARRALEICRRATELPAPDETVKISHIEQAIKEMTNSNIVRVIRNCCQLEKLFLRSLCDVTFRSNLEECELFEVIDQLLAICVLEGIPRPSVTSILKVCHRLKCSRLIFSDHSVGGILQRVMLNVTQDDIHYALQT